MFCSVLYEVVPKQHWGLGCEVFFLVHVEGDQVFVDVLLQLEAPQIGGLCQCVAQKVIAASRAVEYTVVCPVLIWASTREH